MERRLEPELMEDPEQAQAYALADFSAENQMFVDLFRGYFPDFCEGMVVDLGCGPADIPIRFVRAIPDCRVTGVDASPAMIELARDAVRQAGCGQKIDLKCQRVQQFAPTEPADAVISNSLAHHVPNPLQFWYAVKRAVKPGGVVLVMDLLRPDSTEEAQAIVDRYAAGASAMLRRDFYNSLLAAYTEDEVAAHLAQMNLSRLLIEVVDDRHWVVGGHVV